MSEFHAEAPQAIASEGLAQGLYVVAIERDSIQRPFGRKATNLLMSYHAPRYEAFTQNYSNSLNSSSSLTLRLSNLTQQVILNRHTDILKTASHVFRIYCVYIWCKAVNLYTTWVVTWAIGLLLFDFLTTRSNSSSIFIFNCSKMTLFHRGSNSHFRRIALPVDPVVSMRLTGIKWKGMVSV